MYKLRIYKLSGSDKGNLDHEEMFDTKEQMDKRYDECKINKNKQLLICFFMVTPNHLAFATNIY
jgi:hypothetical protein